MKKIAIILSVAAAFAATPAYAQGMGVSPRIELKVGYDELGARVRLDDSALIEDDRQGGIGFGIEAGVDANITERVLLGVYGGYEFPKISDCGALFGGDEFCIRNKRNLTAGLRGGVHVGEGGVIYVKGGLSKARVRFSYDGTRVADFDASDSVSGWHVGGGFEVPVSGGVYVKGEYVHTRYKDAIQGALAATDSINPSRHQLMAGIGFRFGAR